MVDYKEAGVDIERGNKFVNEIKEITKKTDRKEVLKGIGGFAGLFALQKYKNPVLISSTDGVGTKVLLAKEFKKWKGIGIDCVAMSVNDIACLGAEPLFFLDYLASEKTDLFVFKELIQGMVAACKEVGCALLGGETAEMPGVYPSEVFDCAGFAVGVAEREELIDGSKIKTGDAILGVASNGFHSNGYSLIRKILKDHSLNLQMSCAETGLSLAETLLTPTKLYPPLILHLKKQFKLKGIAHITGGGLIENPPRILPEGTQMEFKEGSWPIPQYMKLFKQKGNLNSEEFYRTFNAGIGLVFVVNPQEKEALLKTIHAFGDKAWEIGHVTEGKKPQVVWVRG